jgi:hypothetical protein
MWRRTGGIIVVIKRLVPVLATGAAALVAPSCGLAAIAARPHHVPAGTTRTMDVDFWNDRGAAVTSVLTRIPENAVLVSATASDPAWMATRAGRSFEWRGGRLAPGTHLHVMLRLRFTRAGPSIIGTRMTYADGFLMESPLLVDVHGAPSQTDLAVVLVAGVAIFVGSILVLVLGRRALRG